MNKKGVLAVISGFSGAGKGTVISGLMDRYDNYALSISATTRAPRLDEENGKDYFFVTEEEFQNMILEDQLIEFAKYVNNYYGTPKAYVDEQLCLGKDVILEIEIQGALKIKEKFPDTLLLFIAPPSAKELNKRLVSRGTESKEVIISRLQRANEEACGIDEYHYILVNDDLDTCIDTMHSIIQNERWNVKRNQDFINNLKTQLLEYSKGE
ncbi:MAG TPA: guanylate kinase [Candidatus Merdenecus merdavium]|nr:guanylate kinase [Candidatus Merdenecus merdavium]